MLGFSYFFSTITISHFIFLLKRCISIATFSDICLRSILIKP